MRKPAFNLDETAGGSRVRLISADNSTTTLRFGALGTVVQVRHDGSRVVGATVAWDAGVTFEIRTDEHLWEVLPEDTPPAREPAAAIAASLNELRDAGASSFEVAVASIRQLQGAGVIGRHGPLTLRQAFLLEHELRSLLRRCGYIGRNESPLVRLAEEAVACAYGGMVADDPANPGWDVVAGPLDDLADDRRTRIQVKAATVPARDPTTASWSVNVGEFDILVALAITPWSGEVLYAYELRRPLLEDVLPKSRTLSFHTATKHGRNISDAVQRGMELSNSPDYVTRLLESREE